MMNSELDRSRFSLVRIRAVGFLSDPNDFAQFLLIVLPLVTLVWARGKGIRNFFLVVAPCVLIIYGVYLTHSRGALLALIALAILFMSRRVSLPVAIALGTLLFLGMIFLGFTGGRDVSVASGSDRIDLWELDSISFGHHRSGAWATEALKTLLS